MNKIGLAVYGLEIYQTQRKKKRLNTFNSRVDFLDIMDLFLHSGQQQFDTDKVFMYIVLPFFRHLYCKE